MSSPTFSEAMYLTRQAIRRFSLGSVFGKKMGEKKSTVLTAVSSHVIRIYLSSEFISIAVLQGKKVESRFEQAVPTSHLQAAARQAYAWLEQEGWFKKANRKWQVDVLVETAEGFWDTKRQKTSQLQEVRNELRQSSGKYKTSFGSQLSMDAVYVGETENNEWLYLLVGLNSETVSMIREQFAEFETLSVQSAMVNAIHGAIGFFELREGCHAMVCRFGVTCFYAVVVNGFIVNVSFSSTPQTSGQALASEIQRMTSLQGWDVQSVAILDDAHFSPQLYASDKFQFRKAVLMPSAMDFAPNAEDHRYVMCALYAENVAVRSVFRHNLEVNENFGLDDVGTNTRLQVSVLVGLLSVLFCLGWVGNHLYRMQELARHWYQHPGRNITLSMIATAKGEARMWEQTKHEVQMAYGFANTRLNVAQWFQILNQTLGVDTDLVIQGMNMETGVVSENVATEITYKIRLDGISRSRPDLVPYTTSLLKAGLQKLQASRQISSFTDPQLGNIKTDQGKDRFSMTFNLTLVP